MSKQSLLALLFAGALGANAAACRGGSTPETGTGSGAAPLAAVADPTTSTAADGSVPGTQPVATSASTASTAGAAPSPASPDTVATMLGNLLPANADLLASIDVGAVLAEIRAAVSSVPGAALNDEAVNALGRHLLSMAEVPADVRDRIVPVQLGVVVLAGWFNTESVVLAMPAAAFVDAPAADAAVQNLGSTPLQIARRGEFVLIGLGAEFTNAVARAPGAAGGASAVAWPDGWNALPQQSVVRILMPSVESIPADARADLEELGLGQIRRGAFGLALDGSTVLVVDSDSDDALRRSLAAGYQYASQSIAGFRAMTPPGAQGWPAYFDLLLRGLYSHLHIDRSGTATTVRIDAGACDPGLVLPGLIVGLSSIAAEEMEPGAPVTWQPISQPLASSCDAIAGPAGRLPVSLTSLAPTAIPEQGLLAVFDYGALLREGLPTAFGFAPFSLRAADVAEVLSPSTAGLSAWDASDGSGAAYFDITGTLVNAAWGAVLPAAVAGAVPPVPDPAIGREVRPGVGLVIGNPAVTSRLAAAASSDWQRAIAAMPAGTTLAYAMSGGFVRQAAAQSPVTELADIYASTRLMAFGVDGLRPRALVLVVDGDANALAANIEQRFAAAGRNLSASVSPQLSGLAPVWEAWASAFSTRAVDGSTLLMEFQIPDSLSNADLVVLGAALVVASGAWEQYRTLSQSFGTPSGPPEALPPDPAPTGGSKPPPPSNPKP